MRDRPARAALVAATLLVGCGHSSTATPDGAPPPADAAADPARDAAPDAFVDPNARFDPAGFDGLPSNVIPDLAAPCAIDAAAGTLTLLLRGDETGYVGLRAGDHLVVASAKTAAGGACEVPSTYVIAIGEDPASPGAAHVILDYADGLFAVGASAPGVTIALGAGSSLVVRGTRGPDTIDAGTGAHGYLNVDGAPAPDVQFDGISALTVSAGPDDDVISAADAANALGGPLATSIAFAAYGGPGADALTGGKGANRLDGGDGDDRFPQTMLATADELIGGKGMDTVDYATRTAAVSVTVCSTCSGPACATCLGDDGGTGEGDTVHEDIEIVVGGQGADTLDGTHAACSDGAPTPAIGCTFRGNESGDFITGSALRDTIEGGPGNDTLNGGLGDDHFDGGSGVDTVSYAGRTTTVTVSLDNARPWSPGQNGEAGELDTFTTDIENLTGGSGADELRGNDRSNILRGGPGADVIEGGMGNDSLYGDAEADTLYGGPGNDMLVGGAGADALRGGDGDDFLDTTDLPAAADTTIDCDGTNDQAGAAGVSPGVADALVRDATDAPATGCEL